MARGQGPGDSGPGNRGQRPQQTETQGPSSSPPSSGPGDTLSAVGKYLLLKVPDFSDDYFPNLATQKTVMTSYLRLGAHPKNEHNVQLPEPGDELLTFLPQAGPPGDPRLGENNAAAGAWDSTRTAAQADAAGTRDVVFIDDVRERDPGKPGHGLDKVDRQKETSKLLTRGGWRDHSDGNRITTTYGDKVEVVRGNYKMVVMGRQEDPGEAMGWDTAGSHIQDFAPGTMPGASVYQEFIEDYTFDHGGDAKQTGVWLLVNSTENVWEYARNAGNFRDQNWGDLHESYIGSENPKGISTSPGDGMQGHPDNEENHGPNADNVQRPPFSATSTGLVRSNPKIIERTWAKEIDSKTGSSAWRIPEINDATWADKITEETQVTGMAKSTTVVGASIETTAVGAAVTTTAAASIVDTTTAATVVETSIVGASLSTSIAKVGMADIAIAPLMGDVDIHGLKIELALGLRLSMEFGAWYEIQIGPHDGIEIPDDTTTKLKKVEKALEDQRQAINFNASVLKHNSNGVKMKFCFGKIDLGL